MKKKILTILLMTVLVFSLVGCSSEINLFYYSGEETNYYYLEIKMSNEDITRLNSSAESMGVRHGDYQLSMFANRGANEAWTVEDYVTALMQYRPFASVSYQPLYFEFYRKDKTDTHTSYWYQLEILKADDTITVQIGDPLIDESFLFYNVRVEQSSPFKDYRNEFNQSYDNNKQNSAMEAIVNGWTRNIIKDGVMTQEKLLPSFADAFPIAKKNATGQFDKLMNPDNLKLSYLFSTNYKLITSGESYQDDSGNVYYSFPTLFNGQEPTIVYEYIRANTLGWNILSISLGLITVSVLFLYCYLMQKRTPKKSEELRVREKFPYDPFAENNDNDDNNPFKGY